MSKDISDNHPDPEINNDNLTLEEQMQSQLTWLRQEHRRLDSEIKAFMETKATDMIKIQRMKKVKLSMKDQITCLENQLTPDIIA
ncbi:MAG: DUF465 domain-containing protein [Maricaulaceae bacterium]